MRLHELVKKSGKSGQEVKDELKKRSIEVKSNLSVVEPQVAEEILAFFSGAPAPEKEAPVPKEMPRIVVRKAAPAVIPKEDEDAPPAPVVQVPAPVIKPPAPRIDPRLGAGNNPSGVKVAPAPVVPKAPTSIKHTPPPPKSAPVVPKAPTPVSVVAPALVPKPAAPLPAPKVEAKTEAPAAEEPAAVAPEAVEEQPRRILRMPETVTVAELAELMGVKAVDVIKKLMEYKIMATINQKLEKDVTQTLALDFGFDTEIIGLYGEDLLEAEIQDDPKDLLPRPPVVTIMGHVDHGKTSLLDAIRSSNVAAGEHGGITQHIGAYKVSLPGKGDVVFLDTPGHAAFTAMRARGAAVTDVVVLVVAADDGVMPQTVEAVDHAKAAGVPIVVAVNKIDKEAAKPERVMQELAKMNLMPEEWGGKTIYVNISAKKRLNLDKLLEMLVLEAELLELKANPHRVGKGVVIEAKLDRGRGPVATVLIQSGTVRVGDIFVIGNYHGRVRALINDHGKKMEEAGPSTPVEILGISGVPTAGDGFQVVVDERLARQISSKRLDAQQERDRRNKSHVKLDDLFDHIKAGDLKELKIIIKSDVTGSSEAIKDSLEKILSDKVKVRVIHAGVGAVNESDVMLAVASDAIVLGFHVKADNKASELAKSEQVDVRFYSVIYELVNDVRSAMEGLLEPHVHEVVVGKAEVRGIFRIQGSPIAGSYITSGKVSRSSGARLLRDGEQIWAGKISSLKRFKDDVKEVGTGMECGVGLEKAPELKVGDSLEFTTEEEVAQKL